MAALIIIEAVIAIAGIAYGIYESRKARGDLSASGTTRLNNVRFQTSAYGGAIPLIYGRNRVSANIIWYGSFKTIPHTTSGGGKGGGTQTYVSNYTYTASIVWALGFGVVSNIAQVYRDKKVFQGRVATGNTLTTAAEVWVIPSGSPHQVTVSHSASWTADQGVTVNGVALVAGTDYTVGSGVYTFLTHFGATASIAYQYSLQALWQTAINQAGMSLFTGTTSQTPWPYLTTNYPGQDLAYRNIAYMTGQDYDLGSSGALGNHSFEVDGNLQYGVLPGAQTFTATLAGSFLTSAGNTFVNGTAVKLSSTGSLPYFLQPGVVYWVVGVSGNNWQVSLAKSGVPLVFNSAGGAGSGTFTATPQMVDANVKDVVNDLLTNALTGAGFPTGSLGSLTALSNYCIAAGIFVSPYYSGQKTAAEMVTQLLTIANAAPFFSEGLLKVTPLTDVGITGNGVTFTPNVTPVYNLTDDDYQPTGGDPVTCVRKSQADAYNHIQVKFNNRANSYNEEVVEARDQADIDLHGLRTMSPVTLPEIAELAVARSVAQILLQRVLYLRNTWSFKLPIKFLLLEPTDLVTLTDSGLGLNQYPVRILSVEEDGDGLLTIEAEDYLGGIASTATYPAQVSAGVSVDANADPGNVNAPLFMEGPGYLTVAGYEIWAAIAGGANWGGAQVWLSTDRQTYTLVETAYGGSRYGTLTATFASGTDPDTTHTCSIDLTTSSGSLTSGSAADADAFKTLCYCDGELIAYSVANLTGASKYDLLSYIRRGVYNTPIGAHSNGSNFARLDAGVVKIPYDPALVGQTVYVKFVSFNLFGFHLQDISQVTEYAYTIQGGLGAPNNVSGFTATQQGTLAMFTWTLLTAWNISGYEIRYIPQGSTLTWSQSTELTKVTKGTQVTSARLPPGNWTCMIKAVDDSGRYSVTESRADIGLVNSYQIVKASPQAVDWLGALPFNFDAYDFTQGTWSAYFVKPNITTNGNAPNAQTGILDPFGGWFAQEFAMNNGGGPGNNFAGIEQLNPGYVVYPHLVFTVKVWLRAKSSGTAPNISFGLNDGSANTAIVPTTTWTEYTYQVDNTDGHLDGDTGGRAGFLTTTNIQSSPVPLQIYGFRVYRGTRDCVPHYLGYLVPDSTSKASAGSGFEVFDNYVYQPVTSFLYQTVGSSAVGVTRDFDLSMDGQVRLYAPITAALGPGASGDISGIISKLEYRLNAGSYAGFQNWSIGQVTCEFYHFQLSVDVTKGTVRIDQYTPTADDPTEIQGANSVSIPSGGLTITYPIPYFNVPTVQATEVTGANSPLNIVLSAISNTSFHVQMQNSSGAGRAGTLNWQSSGV